jgi:hypothetical protein
MLVVLARRRFADQLTGFLTLAERPASRRAAPAMPTITPTPKPSKPHAWPGSFGVGMVSPALTETSRRQEVLLHQKSASESASDINAAIVMRIF